MKRTIIIALSLCFSTLGFSIPFFAGTHNKATIVGTDEIPQDVLTRFYDSFILDAHGNFLGAMVGEMKEYITLPEILQLISNAGHTVEGPKVIDKHKPRLFSGGCKYNESWICQFDID